MHKKFILISVALAFLWGTNSAIAMDNFQDEPNRRNAAVLPTILQTDKSPGAEEWTDNHDQTPPARVRKAADDLWVAVASEGKAAFEVDWGVIILGGRPKTREEKGQCSLKYCLSFLICSCCFYQCYAIEQAETEYLRTTHDFELRSVGFTASSTKRIEKDQKEVEVKRFLEDFKSAVNESVKKPVAYSGDIQFATIELWVRDGAWTKNCDYDNSDHQPGRIASGRRDLSPLHRKTIIFVNEHGGWLTDADAVVAKKETNDDEEAALRKELLRAQIAALKEQQK